MADNENLIEQHGQIGFWATLKAKYKKLSLGYKLLALFFVSLGIALAVMSGVAGLTDRLNLIIFISGVTLSVVTFLGHGLHVWRVKTDGDLNEDVELGIVPEYQVIPPQDLTPVNEEKPAPTTTTRSEIPTTLQEATSSSSASILSTLTPTAETTDKPQNTTRPVIGEQLLAANFEKITITNSIQRQADKGDPEAQYKIGFYFCAKADKYFFDNNTQEAKKAFEAAEFWYLKAAQQGYPKAQYEMGCSYHRQGLSGFYRPFSENEKKEAFGWYLKAGEQGHARAQLKLGDCYASGYGVEKNMKLAVEWYQKGIGSSFSDDYYRNKALYSLGKCYEEGGDPREAAVYYRMTGATDSARMGIKRVEQGLKEDVTFWHKRGGDPPTKERRRKKRVEKGASSEKVPFTPSVRYPASHLAD